MSNNVKNIPAIITKSFLKENPNYVFVFGDNLKRVGKKGAAKLRDCKNTYGFVTKKYPSFDNEAYYKKHEYIPKLQKEIILLENEIKSNPDNVYLISQLGSGLANKFGIWDLIEPKLMRLKKYENVYLLFGGKGG